MKGWFAMSEGYNGWKNWETWNTNLHFDGFFQDIAQDIFDNIDYCDFDNESSIKNEFLDQLFNHIESTIEEFADEFIGKNHNSLFACLLNSSIKEIDCGEIASHYWDTIDLSKYEEYLEELKEEEEERNATNE